MEWQAGGYPYTYNGKERNEELGLEWLDYGARWYDAVIGRWNAVDPLADHPNQIDKSPFAYAWNNPVKLTDPDGRCPICPFIAKGASGAAIDYFMQGAFNYAGGMDVGAAFSPSNIDKTDVLVSGLQSALPWSVPGGKYGKAAAAAVGDVVFNAGKASLNGEDYSAAQAGQDFLIGFVAQLGSEQVAELFGDKADEILYRFDTRNIDEINAAGGFNSWGDNMDLLDHASGKNIQNKTSGHVSTSKSKTSATNFSGGRKGYLYEIQNPGNGVDVNKKLGSKSPFPNEKEIAIPKNIPTQNIVRQKPINQ